MEKSRAIILIIIVFTLSFWGAKKSVQENVRKIGFNSNFYPRRYIIVPRWIRKQSKIKQRMVPRFLFFEMLFTNLYIIYFLVMVSYVLFSKSLSNVFLFVLPLYICPIEIILSSIMTFFYLKGSESKRQKEKR